MRSSNFFGVLVDSVCRWLASLRGLLATPAKRASSLSFVAIAVFVCVFLFSGGDTSQWIGARMSTSFDGDEGDEASSSGADSIPAILGRDKAEVYGLETAAAYRSDWSERVRFTGQLELNTSRMAHVSSLVDGVIREVPVEIGQTVKKGQILAYIDSREVGEAKLQLAKDELRLKAARRTHEWHSTTHENTVALLDLLDRGRSLDEIVVAFRDRPVGAYREQLVSAKSRLNRAVADFERIRQLGASSIIPEKEVIRARAEHEAANASYEALKEQIRFEAQQRALDSHQGLREAEASVAISKSHLFILGYDEADVDSMDPLAEAERVAYYPIRSPIDGVVISKDASLSRHVDRGTELMEIADLSSIWLRADVFEKDLGAIRDIEGKSIVFACGGYPGQRFTATVFSTGNIVNDQTRAARLLATVENSDQLLKPGMFVTAELTARNDANVLQLPVSAIQRHAGATFVFVADDSGGFGRRDVEVGRSTTQTVEILSGMREGELAVVQGGFALKSEMLSDLMRE